MRIRTTMAALAAACFVSAPALAGTVIYNTGDPATATIALGVNDEASLNTQPNITANAGATGLAFRFPDGRFRDATAPGCLCEGWGVSVNGTNSMFSNVSTNGINNNITVGALTNVTGSTVTTTSTMANLPGIVVTHAHAPADKAPGALFKVTVTISNSTGATVNDVKYVRVMDWDIPPTEFREFVTIKGTSTTTLLERSHNNGFATANPLGLESPITAATLDADFEDAGPLDHGAYFRFNFGSIADGESYTFNIFYGAAANEAGALAAIAAEGIELFSLGQSTNSLGGVANDAPTFIFGFSGVGGTPVIPAPVSEPATLALMGLGLIGFAMARRRKQA